ncbi:TPA: hypothetical protein ACH3X3_002427 [Trebouxia sp. C0006]
MRQHRDQRFSACAVERKSINMARIEDDHERQATFQRRKNGLMRRAMELSVLCGCDIAMFLFAPDERLSQYTSSEMEGLLDRYSRSCQQPHESRSNQDLLRMLPPDLAADVMALHPQRKRRGRPVVVEEGEGDVSSMSDGSALQHRQMDILKPLGLAPEDVKLPLSPRSEDAYARINEEFDMLYSQLQDPGEQAGQNHAERSPTSNDSLAGGATGRGKRGGRPATMKKKGSVKPKKKESAAATKKTGRGTKGATPADSHTPPPEEVVAEGGMPTADERVPTADERVPTAQGGLHTGEGRMEAPAASSAGQVAPAKGQHPVEGPSTDRVVPTSAESQQGNDQKSGTAAAPQQPPSAQATSAPQAEVTASPLSPTASSASPRPSTTQVPGPGTGSQSLQQPGRASAMPLGAVDMSRAGGPAPALVDDNSAEDVTTGLVRH